MADNIPSRVRRLVQDAEDFRDRRSADRKKAMQFYDGDAECVPHEKDRSKLVSRDVRAAIKKVLPSVVRTILGNDEVVEFQPVNMGDEEAAQQASDFINYVVLAESHGKIAIHDAVMDALKLRNGILYAYVDKRVDIRVSDHAGLDDEAFAALVADDDVEPLQHTETMEPGPDGIPVTVHAVKLRRKIERSAIKVECVAPEDFLIDDDAITFDDAALIGVKRNMRRTDLVAMGYDAETVRNLPSKDEDDTGEEMERRDNVSSSVDDHASDWTMQEIDYWELYVRMDQDGDGIAELSRMCFAGSVSEKGLLENEPCDEVPFAGVCIERQPHQWEGVSIADDVMEIQTAKTVFLRNTADNIYWQNNLQPIMQEGTIVNPEAVLNPAFGKPIRVSRGVSAGEAIGYAQVPFVGNHSFAMLDYLDKEASERTGISDASAGMAPDALQTMTAKASAMVEQAGIGQTELMVRTAAEGLRVFFRKLLRLVIRYQDKPRTVRLRDKWVSFDPRHWNAEMDATVNVGLGAGTRERDMMVMGQVIALQEKLLAAFGPDNPFVKPDNVYTAIAKMVEAAGLKTPRMYFTEPDPQEVAAKMEAAKNAPSPEMQKAQAQMQVEQMKAEAAAQRTEAEFALRREQANAEIGLKREQLEAEMELKREQITAELLMRRELATVSGAGRSSTIHMGGEPG